MPSYPPSSLWRALYEARMNGEDHVLLPRHSAPYMRQSRMSGEDEVLVEAVTLSRCLDEDHPLGILPDLRWEEERFAKDRLYRGRVRARLKKRARSEG